MYDYGLPPIDGDQGRGPLTTERHQDDRRRGVPRLLWPSSAELRLELP
jgi:hypothetical protein